VHTCKTSTNRLLEQKARRRLSESMTQVTPCPVFWYLLDWYVWRSRETCIIVRYLYYNTLFS